MQPNSVKAALNFEFQIIHTFAPMKENDTISKKRLEKVKCIYNDDVKIIDFLSDLTDREPIHALERFIRWGNHESACLLHNCPADDLVVLILYKSPFGFNEKGNNLILYAYNDLRGLIKYFKGWHEATAEANDQIHAALNDITMLLYHEFVEEEDKNTPSGLRS